LVGRCAWDGGEPGPRKHSLWVTPGEALTTRQGRLSTGEAQTTPERGGGETKFDPHWVLSFRLPLAKIMRLTVFFSKPFALPGTHSRASHRSRASEKSHQRVSAFFLLFFPALAGYSQQRGRAPPPTSQTSLCRGSRLRCHGVFCPWTCQIIDRLGMERLHFHKTSFSMLEFARNIH